ncbi:MAG: anti-sigma factor antagonist [Prolixibacteraceae bacterium]|nr:anti-sigma factor antagonist [Prolixibacteraceae bacterium]
MNSFELIQKDKTVPILKVSGRLDALSSTNFEMAVEPLFTTINFLIIDLGQCSYLSSAGIRILLKTHKKMLAAQGKLIIADLLPEVFHVIEMVGLDNIFNLVDTPELAAEEIKQLQSDCAEPIELKQGNKTFQFQESCKAKKSLLFWKSKDMAGCHELGFSMGYGASAESNDVENIAHGLFVTAGVCAGFMPSDSSIPAEFRVAPQAANIAVLLLGAVSFGEQPSGVLSTKELKLTMQKFISACKLAKQQQQVTEISLMAILNRNPDNPSLSIVLDVETGKDNMELWQHIPDFHQKIILKAGINNPAGLTFKLETLYQTSDSASLSDFLNDNLNIDNIIGVESVLVNEKLQNPVAWLFHPLKIEDADTRKLKIETDDRLKLEPYKNFLIRKLYSDASHVIIEPLHGGFSAQTFQVISFDLHGRKLRPTVLKVADRAMITRESERCKQYALPYIFNNSASVLGVEFHGDRGALVYNFVGIGGEDSRLKWLTHYFHQENIEMLGPLFDKIFLHILKPWYGQAIKTTIYPFNDHDPTLTFFPHIYNTVTELFAISAYEQYIKTAEIGRPLLNPYWFLKYEFPKRREQGFDYFEGICHGDLNMQNILLDENMNVYLIDFSETKPRSVISDFARLEAIFLVDNAPLENEDDMQAYLHYITGFYSADSLQDIPACNYSGWHHEKVQKHEALALRMRKYASESVQGNPDIVPYYLALLEWILPIVCYQSLPKIKKRLSMYICGMLCEKIYMNKDDF